MEQVRLGVIGIGNMGSEHCRNLLAGQVPEIALTAVADRRASRQAWAASHLPGITVFPEGEDLIASGLCDAVLIATPHYQHPTLAQKALEHGLHVMCEKPVGVYTQNVHAPIATAKEGNLTFALMFNQRTNCIYRKLHEVIRSGELGNVKRVNWTITDWYRAQCYYDSGAWRATWAGEGGGTLLNQCPHQLDLLQWLFGMPTKVSAFCQVGKWHDIEVEDDVTAYLEFPNGATGVFIASTADMPGVNRLEVTFDQGRLLCEDGKLHLWRVPVSERTYCFTTTDAYHTPAPIYEEIPTDGQNDQHVGVLRAFAAHLLRGEPLIAEGEEGLNSLMLTNALYLSAWEQRPVILPIDEAHYLSLLNERRAISRHKPEVDVTFTTDHTSGGQTVPDA